SKRSCSRSRPPYRIRRNVTVSPATWKAMEIRRSKPTILRPGKVISLRTPLREVGEGATIFFDSLHIGHSPSIACAFGDEEIELRQIVPSFRRKENAMRHVWSFS